MDGRILPGTDVGNPNLSPLSLSRLRSLMGFQDSPAWGNLFVEWEETMKPKPFVCVLAFALLAVTSAAFAATTWYVDGVNGSDSNNCKSPTTACKTIGHAISLASSGDSISVA